jgi:dGTPase
LEYLPWDSQNLGSLSIRKRAEARESLLSTFASCSSASRGRVLFENPDPIRTAFQRDRDRIIHTNSFRRLKHKTQVFIAPSGDHFVTRLTHTLEVSQLSRTIARALLLNEDLVEAISLAHDLGHTPFGHTGEEELNLLLPGGFKHAEQSLRLVEKLEKGGRGLNLTWEVREGILRHSKGEETIFNTDENEVTTYEASVVKIADAVAYINHDIADAIRAGILSESDLPEEITMILGTSNSARINRMVTDIIANSWAVTGLTYIEKCPRIGMSCTIGRATESLRHFMFNNVYNILANSENAKRARVVVRGLYQYLIKNQDALPEEYRTSSENPARRAADYIAGMTDLFALRLAENLGI